MFDDPRDHRPSRPPRTRRGRDDTDHTEMDIWGYCPGCDTWFRCPDWFDRDAPQPCCGVCGREPTAIENRAADEGLVLVD